MQDPTQAPNPANTEPPSAANCGSEAPNRLYSVTVRGRTTPEMIREIEAALSEYASRPGSQFFIHTEHIKIKPLYAEPRAWGLWRDSAHEWADGSTYYNRGAAVRAMLDYRNMLHVTVREIGPDGGPLLQVQL